jgi:hypothetical protein
MHSATAEYLNLTNKGSGSFGNGSFVWVDQQSTGTGVIDPFLTIQANGTEAGFNTNAAPPLDAKPPNTQAVLVSDFGVVNLNGTPSIRFLLDINESAGGPQGAQNELLSLDNLQVYVSTNDSIADLATLQGQTKLYDIDTAGACSAVSPAGCVANASNGVNLNFSLNPGSGAGDMYFYLPASLFSAHQSKYLYLYSSFGALGGDYDSSDGFEEWARVDNAAPIPEPTTYAFVLSLLSSAVVLYKKRRSAGTSQD